MTPQKIMDGMAEKNRMLSQKNDEYLQLVEKRAQAERAYDKSLANKIIELKSEGQAVTLIKELARGDKLVANNKYEYEVSKGVEKACLKAMDNIEKAIETYRSLLSWMKAEMQSQ